MKKYIVILTFVFVCALPAQDNSLISEIQGNKCVLHAVRLAADIVYDKTYLNQKAVQQMTQPNNGTALLKGQHFFHNEAGQSVNAHYSSFSVGGIKGCVYTVDDDRLRKKVFVAFPGTQSTIEWSKNFFGISSFKHNLQQSYYDDIETLFSSKSEYAFFNVLKKHLANENKHLESNGNDYEYYFVGHSRGGGLALLAAKRFSQEGSEFIGREKGRVKVVTFCAPKIANAHVEQLLFIEALGFKNIVHFMRPSDIAPQFPFRFVENYGVKIPLKSYSFGFILSSHQMPNEEETDDAVKNFNNAQDIGWGDPLRNLFSLDLSLLRGACFSFFIMKVCNSVIVSGSIRGAFIWGAPGWLINILFRLRNAQ